MRWSATGSSGLHRVEGLAHLNAAAALKHRAFLRQGDGRVEAIRLDHAVAAHGVRAAAISDAARAGDSLRLSDRVATVDDASSNRSEPALPGLHDLRLVLWGLGHAAAVVREQVIRHSVNASLRKR